MVREAGSLKPRCPHGGFLVRALTWKGSLPQRVGAYRDLSSSSYKATNPIAWGPWAYSFI